MRRALATVVLAGISACVGFNIRASDECEAICEKAAACGFLPSALGWSDDGAAGSAQVDCERRCNNSPESDANVARIVECFTGAPELPGVVQWCTSESAEDAAYRELWDRCVDVSGCLQQQFRDSELRGDVALTVQAIEWAEYETHLGLPLAPFGAQSHGTVDQQSCRPALCSEPVCGSLECEIDDDCEDDEESGGAGATGATGDTLEEACSEVCELPEGEVCDTRLCRIGLLTISSFCQDLAARKITLKVYERDRLPVVEVFQDVEAGINANCEKSALRFDPETYDLVPGPIRVVAAVEGTLTGAQLAEIGYFEAGEMADPAAETPYCVEFVGPAMTVRAGESKMVVPVCQRAEMAALEGVAWRRCPER